MADENPVGGAKAGDPATEVAVETGQTLADARPGGAEARPPVARRLPISPQIGPYVVNVEEGKTYLWCACGLSKSQPFCDGSHAGTEMSPVAFEAMFDAEFHLCGCKRSDNKPYCFGNCRGHHRRLKTS